ncbi:hypothetical protein IE53DRAFT_21597 [Violaceomyces palustris]|uniref:Uncharacterized protein n=1 Tax=Violaceomyces palustris TaxID=1673888 RepID=A0ACD0P2A3_9BASI|nr:hypothetical protein IE53DRAFT_21597 [Violaceomyces palustris]
MAEPSLASPQNLLHVQWKNPEYLSYLSSIQQQQQQQQQQSQTNKQTSDPNSSPLNESNVLSYFSTSPFFDRRSNNEQIRMQNIANSQQPGLNQSSAQFEEEELKRFTGLEFALVHHKPPGCFVIHKRWRYGPDHAVPIAAYYVVNDSIYQAPDLYNVLASRLVSSIAHSP